MKKLIMITAALLSMLATPTLASSAAEWSCGKGIKAVAGKGEFFISMGKAYEANYPNQGAVTWSFREPKAEIRFNGRLCKQTN